MTGRLLGVEVTAGLGGLRFYEMEEGKGRGFDDTFKLSTLAVVVIFLPATFQYFHNNNDDLPIVWARSLLARFRSWRFVGPTRLVACKVFGDLYDLRSWLPIDWQFPSLVGALLSRA
ncbi:hypothetical protein TIFTF001_017599 [Ficus carica]|uniref:Uncharacterized protein n=1 Tax=Ficus carica TaxID=3494 RepID=A0AA88A5C4_FICCA|nr:hypothetical protein TIFTF001_017599 [Ficus carica]